MLFGLMGAVSFGTGDFLGGIASKFVGSLRATLVSSTFGFLTLIALLAVTGGSWSKETVIWGALSGLAAVIGIVFLYASLAIGPMSILSPIGALVGAMVPVVWEFSTGEKLSALSYVGIVIALAAVWFVGFTPNAETVRPTARGLTFALIAGVFIGTFLILIDRAPDDGGLLPLVLNRLTQISLLALVLLVAAIVHRVRTHRNPLGARLERSDLFVGEGGAVNWRQGVRFAAFAGMIDAIGNSFILWGLLVGNLSVVSVLGGMYPGGTILLAALVLRERIVRLQYLGFALALLAAALLTLG